MKKRDIQFGVSKPQNGWKKIEDMDEKTKAKLLPIAETLAMMDGNAFLTIVTDGQPFAYQYLPEAHAVYEGNGGDNGWASEASFARAYAHNIDPEISAEDARRKYTEEVSKVAHLEKIKTLYFDLKSKTESKETTDLKAQIAIMLYEHITHSQKKPKILIQIFEKYGAQGTRKIAVDLSDEILKTWNFCSPIQRKKIGPIDEKYVSAFAHVFNWKNILENQIEDVEDNNILKEKILDYLFNKD